MTNTPEPAASDAIVEAVGDALATRCMAIFGSKWSNDVCWEFARAAIAAYHAALPGEFGELSARLSDGLHFGYLHQDRVDSLAAITALEARLAGAYERCIEAANGERVDEDATGHPDDTVYNDAIDAVVEAISALAAKGE
jgi:hypothetical protein